MLKKIVIIILAAVICLGLPGFALKPEVSDNGGDYVSKDGAVYYWKYKDDSFDKSALWGDFGRLAGEGNQLVKRLEDGTETVIYQGSGFGGIWIFQDRFYLTGTAPASDSHNDYEGDIYSINMEGKDRKDYGTGTILAMAEDSSTLIGTLADYKSTLFLIDCAAGRRTELCENAVYLGCQGGYVYYEDCNESGSLKIMKAAADSGQKETVLYIPGYAKQNGLDEYSSSYASILSAQLLDGYLYFNYGTIAGTASLYQEGVIARVGLDGSGYQLIAGAEIPKNQWLYAAAGGKDGISIYTSDLGGNNIEISPGDMKTRPAAEAKGTLGEVLTDNRTAYFYPKADNKKVVIVTDERLNPASGTEDSYFRVRDAQISGKYIYYVTEYSTHKPDKDVGWRYCYERQETVLYRRLLDGGEPEALYRY